MWQEWWGQCFFVLSKETNAKDEVDALKLKVNLTV
jgi:hypothetical protein